MALLRKILSFFRLLLARLRRPEPTAADLLERSVLVGTLSRREQLDVCLSCGFYHIPAKQLETGEGIRTVAIYQSLRMFPERPGIRWVGTVESVQLLPRYAIREIYSEKTEPYWRFRISRWRELPWVIEPKELGFVSFLTTPFLLKHSRQVPQLWLQNDREYRLYHALERVQKTRTFDFEGCRAELVGEKLVLSRNRALVGEYPLETIEKAPYGTVERILADVDR